MSGRSINPAILKPRLGFAVFALILLLCGLVMAFSASAITSISAGNDSTSYLFSQGKMALLGLALAYAIYRVIPFELWKHDKAVWVIWFACIALILATALFGVSHGGAKRWIELPLIGEIQPGEFIKVGLALVACKNIDDYDQGMMNHRMLFFRLAFLVALPIGAIYLTQSDLGTSIICFVCLIAALYFTNKPLAVIGAIIAVVGFFALINATGDGYRGERMVYLDPWNDGENGFGAGYQTIHSLYALADGGLFGVGLGNSREKFLYLPANNTDYVFAVVCEELGVIGGVAIALCFLALFYFGLKISQNCVDSFSKGLSGCLTTMLVFQAFLNIGCAISLLPMTGKPLPFFSVGGSSMLATMIILGFVLACSRASEFESPEAEYTRRRENLRVTTHAPREERSVPRGWQNASRSWQDMPWEGRGVSQSGQRVSQGWQNVSRGARQWQLCALCVTRRKKVGMLVVLSGGGTAGHINPALALAEVLQERGCQVKFAGTPQGVEARLVPQAGIEFVPFEAQGFNRTHPLSLPHALRVLSKSEKQARAWLDTIKPQVAVGFGGYVSIPVGHAAKSKHIPLVIHEQNSVMGLANKLLAKSANTVCVTYACAAQGVVDSSKVIVTGNPVRAGVLSSTREEGRALLGIPENALMLLVFGGSLGARHINQALCAMKDSLLAYPDLYVVHITGPKEYDTVVHDLSLTSEQEKRWIVMGYQDRMGETMAAADAIISRAGATSLAEISARAIPALLVPFPHATADHQTMNARAYVQAGCASMIPDDALDTAEFPALVTQLIEDPSLRDSMHAAALKQETANAACRLADVVLNAAQC